MTSEELEKLRADLADLDARRAHDHDDPVRLANPLVAMFDEATVRKLLAALDEARGYAQQLTRRVERGNAIAQRREEELQRERDEARRELLDLDLVLPAACGSRVDAARQLEAECNEARAQLAALWEAARRYLTARIGTGRHDEERGLLTAVTETEVAAAEHERSVRADERAKVLREAAGRLRLTPGIRSGTDAEARLRAMAERGTR